MITYRSEKGAPLSIEEMDNNFHELEQRLDAFEKTNNSFDSLVDAKVDGDQMTLISNRGRKIGPIQLPIISYTPRGKWESKTDYAGYDVASHASGAYVCTTPHCSSDFANDKQHWRLLLQGGGVETKENEKTEKCARIYEPATLPKVAELGQISIYLNEKSQPSVIYGDGYGWRYAATNTKV